MAGIKMKRYPVKKTPTYIEARSDSLLKWNLTIENVGDPPDAFQLPKRIQKYKFHCGFCEKYLGDNVISIQNCLPCPLVITDSFGNKLTCNDIGHPYDIWKREFSLSGAHDVRLLILNTPSA